MHMKVCIRFSFLLIFFCSFLKISGQEIRIEEHQKKLELLNDREKVDYIIKNFYSLYSSNFDQAVALTQFGAAIARKNNWKDKEAYCLMYHAVIQGLRGNFQHSLSPFLRAKDLFDSLHHDDGLARLHNEMAVFYNRQFDRKKCDEFLLKAKMYAEKAGNKEELGTTYGHQATLLERDGKFQEADALYNEVYKLRLEQKDSVGLGYILLDLSNMALRKNDLKKAINYIEQSTLIRKQIGDKMGVAINLVQMGEAYFSVKDYKNAIRFMNEGLKQAEAINYIDFIRYTYDQLAKVYAEMDDYKLAFLSQQKSYAFNDSLYSTEKAKAIADTQTKYETEKKAQEIILQRAQLVAQQATLKTTYIIIVSLFITVMLAIVIFILVRNRHKREQQLLQNENELSVREAYIQATIQSQENERKRFAEDLHDGMGQLISALRLSLNPINKNNSQESRVDMVSKAEGILTDMNREIRSIAFNLMPHTLIQYGLVPALSEMAERINQSSDLVVRISSFDVPDRLNEVQEINLYRIIQEWINNIMKYSGASLIEVQLVGHDQEIVLTVEDNGNGFNSDTLKFSSGNGWKNIQSRLNLIKGSIEVDSQPGKKGTTLVVKIVYLKIAVPVNA